MTAPCTPAPLAYTDSRGVENLNSGHRTRKTCGIFVCVPRLDSVYGVEGWEIPNTQRRSVAVSNLHAAPYRVALPISKINRSASHGQ